jgi:hypothetical protein
VVSPPLQGKRRNAYLIAISVLSLPPVGALLGGLVWRQMRVSAAPAAIGPKVALDLGGQDAHNAAQGEGWAHETDDGIMPNYFPTQN